MACQSRQPQELRDFGLIQNSLQLGGHSTKRRASLGARPVESPTSQGGGGSVRVMTDPSSRVQVVCVPSSSGSSLSIAIWPSTCSADCGDCGWDGVRLL